MGTCSSKRHLKVCKISSLGCKAAVCLFTAASILFNVLLLKYYHSAPHRYYYDTEHGIAPPGQRRRNGAGRENDGDVPSTHSPLRGRHIVASGGNESTSIGPGFGFGGDGDGGVRISFRLHDPADVPFSNVFNPNVRCRLGMYAEKKKKPPTTFRTGILPQSLVRAEMTAIDDDTGLLLGGKGGTDTDTYTDTGGANTNTNTNRTGRVLDFTATISTDLKILFVGDSVMVQLAQAFDEGALAFDERKGRLILWDTWPGHDGLTIAAPTRGGGVTALWRMTALLSMGRKGKKRANDAGGGWSDYEPRSLLNHSYDPGTYQTQYGRGQTRPSGGDDGGNGNGNGNRNVTVGKFDAVIFRVPHGWMPFKDITRERLVEAVTLAHHLLGAQTVVLMTVPFTNNIKTIEDLRALKKTNDAIRDVARNWHRHRTLNGGSDSGGPRHVLVHEFGQYFDHLIWTNARHLGYNVSSPVGPGALSRAERDAEGPDFLFDRLMRDTKFDPTRAMVCAALDDDRSQCPRNFIFLDGMHVCLETMGARYSASVACLMGCVYNRGGDGGGGDVDLDAEDAFGAVNPERTRNLRACEQECNNQFMSVAPVDESWIGRNVTVAAFAA